GRSGVMALSRPGHVGITIRPVRENVELPCGDKSGSLPVEFKDGSKSLKIEAQCKPDAPYGLFATSEELPKGRYRVWYGVIERKLYEARVVGIYDDQDFDSAGDNLVTQAGNLAVGSPVKGDLDAQHGDATDCYNVTVNAGYLSMNVAIKPA